MGRRVASMPEIFVPVSTAELSWRVLGFVNGLRLLASSLLATLFVSIMPETIGQMDPALFAGSATAYFLYAAISISAIRRRAPDVVLQTWTGAFADVLVLSLLTYASGGVSGGIAALVVLSIGATSFILPRRLALSIAAVASVIMLIQPAILLLADTDAVADFAAAAVSAALIVIVAVAITELARVLRLNEELAQLREASANDLAELQRSIAQHLREGVLVVDGNNDIPMISETAAMLLQGGDVPPGTRLDEVSPRLADLLDTWRRYFCDEQRSSPTMMAFDGERRVQLKFVSLDSSTQGPALVFVDDKSRVAAPVWLPQSAPPASIEVNRVKVPRELPRVEVESDDLPEISARQEVFPRESARESARELPRESGRESVREFAREPARQPARQPARESARESAREAARELAREPAFAASQFAASASRASSLGASVPVSSLREPPRRANARRANDLRANTLRENLARQNSFRAALQEVSSWEDQQPRPPAPLPVPAPPSIVSPPTLPPPSRSAQATRPAGSMLTNNDPRLRIILGNALQFGRRESARLERVDLASWCKEFLTEFWQTEEIDADTLRLSAPRESIPVRADPAHLQKLLWTLCTDLLKYGRASNATDPVEIRIGRSTTTQRRYLDVIDRGAVTGPVESKRVFEPFLAAGKAGTGITMFVSRELSPGIRTGANGDPRPGGGVVFRLVFPEAPPPSPSPDP
jgi:signal transduction histidine kinase